MKKILITYTDETIEILEKKHEDVDIPIDETSIEILPNFEYKIIEEHTAGQLEDRVNRAFTQGWKLRGDFIICQVSSSTRGLHIIYNSMFMQVMTKESK